MLSFMLVSLMMMRTHVDSYDWFFVRTDISHFCRVVTLEDVWPPSVYTYDGNGDDCEHEVHYEDDGADGEEGHAAVDELMARTMTMTMTATMVTISLAIVMVVAMVAITRSIGL